MTSAVADFKQFKNGSQFAAWLGVVPRQRSSGGKSVLGGITKHGQSYLRMLQIQGAKSAVMTAERRSDRISQWVLALRERAGWQKAVVALAKQERAHPVGGDDPRRAVRRESPEHQTHLTNPARRVTKRR
jgi:transposase